MKRRLQGFTLIELAIVMLVLTILAAGVLVPLTTSIETRRIAETRNSMATIQDALIGYAMSHSVTIPFICTCVYDIAQLSPYPLALTSGCSPSTYNPFDYCPPKSIDPTQTQPLTSRPHYLPCPDTNNDGFEEARVSGSCPASRGGLPWITLGVKGDDAWGNRYTYAVDQNYSNDHSGFASTPAATTANLNVYVSATCAAPAVMAGIPVIVVSHGPQGRGALNMNGGTPLAPASVAADERQNLNASSGSLPCADATKFVSHDPTDDFDDLVIWLSSNALFNRVCPAGGCP